MLNLFDLIPVSEVSVLICMACALLFGVLEALFYSRRCVCSRSLTLSLALLPLVSAAVILAVNKSVGTGIAVAGTFSLVRFRSAPGSARDILAVFLSVALGICCGAGLVIAAAMLLVLWVGALLLMDLTHFGEEKKSERLLRITVPETLDYEGLFDDLLTRHTAAWSLEGVRTAEMGSVYRLEYRVTLPGPAVSREFLDALRTRNGNLEIQCCRYAERREAI